MRSARAEGGRCDGERGEDGDGEKEEAAHGDSRVAPRSFGGKSFDPPLIESLHRCQAAVCGDFCALALALGALAAAPGVLAQNDAPRVLAVHLDNDINPVTQEYVENESVDRAEEGDYAAMVLVLDTPGGLGSSMRGIVKRFLASTVPVVVYVAPSGSSADSAGAVITMASDLAAMAPQTNIGSSTPISLNGQDISKDLRRKIVNDAAAYVGELAREHDRNVVAARKMVTVASNYGAREAKRIGLVEVDRADASCAARTRSTGRRRFRRASSSHTAGRADRERRDELLAASA